MQIWLLMQLFLTEMFNWNCYWILCENLQKQMFIQKDSTNAMKFIEMIPYLREINLTACDEYIQGTQCFGYRKNAIDYF